MKLENQVVSLELAKKLKSLNVKQESLFAWIQCRDNTFVIGHAGRHFVENEQGSAFTVAELGELLKPAYIDFGWSSIGQIWFATLYLPDKDHEGALKYAYAENEVNEANVRAKMLIYLLQNKLI